jgi:AraC-like DNA-binding protein
MTPPALTYRTIAPPPALAGYVRFFWELEGWPAPGEPYVHRTLADGCAELVFHYRGPFEALGADGRETPSGRAALHGQSPQFQRFVTRGSFGIFGAYLYPFAVPALFALPASAVTGLEVGLPDLLGPEGERLSECMLSAPDAAGRVRLLSGFLAARLGRGRPEPPGVFTAIRHIIRERGGLDVEALAERHCLSRRQFERQFREAAGLSPRRFARIIRFQEAVRHFGSRGLSLTGLAYQCGYYDQSHFIHDFKAFSGHHPRQFFSGQAEGAPVWEKE